VADRFLSSTEFEFFELFECFGPARFAQSLLLAKSNQWVGHPSAPSWDQRGGSNWTWSV
jgi:hypothetical protein